MKYLQDELTAKIPLREENITEFCSPVHTGRGELRVEDGCFVLSAPPTFDNWEEHNCPSDGDYCNFGSCTLVLPVGGKEYSWCNRLTFQAFAEDTGIPAPMLYCGIRNSGRYPVPDIFCRSGTHQVSLTAGKWVTVVWEFPEFCLEQLEEITISMPLNGDFGLGLPHTTVRIRDIRLSRVADPEPYKGWECGKTIAYSFVGYMEDSVKRAVTQIPCSTFTITNIQTGTSLELNAKPYTFLGKTYAILDFSRIRECGTYRLAAGGVETEDFPILTREVFYTALTDKLLGFVHAERCGCAVAGKHPVCHADIVAEHNGEIKSYHGGWHDAGDLSQQTLQTGETAESLLHAAALCPPLADALLEESRWGMDFILHMRFGDGYRATSAGITRWTDGIIGTMDDCAARVHCHAFENYLFAKLEAEAAMTETDPLRREKFAKAAAEDFAFAEARYRTHGMELPVFFEHSYSSPRSLYAAVGVVSCHALYRLTGDALYLEKLKSYLKTLLACQNRVPSLPLSGFFCRDESLRLPVHFTHQSREYLYGEALAAALDLCGDFPDLQEAARAYADYYVKLTKKYASPYRMIPAGVYGIQETNDTPENREAFGLCHLFTDFDSSKESHAAQIRSGQSLGSGWYVKQFPVWFSFRGNSVIFLSQAASLRKLAAALGDNERLWEIADCQLYFLLGCNPFRQSLVYGFGKRSAEPYFALLGQTEGAVPVGIETDGDGDDPFWPCGINATYKEVWLSSATAMLRNL